MRNVILVLAFVVGLTLPGRAEQGASGGEIEHIYGMRITPKGIVFQVYSSGCTRKRDFRVDVFESIPVQILLVRVSPDMCDAYVPYGTKIRYSWKRLGLREGDSFIVINPRAPFTVRQE